LCPGTREWFYGLVYNVQIVSITEFQISLDRISTRITLCRISGKEKFKAFAGLIENAIDTPVSTADGIFITKDLRINPASKLFKLRQNDFQD